MPMPTATPSSSIPRLRMCFRAAIALAIAGFALTPAQAGASGGITAGGGGSGPAGKARIVAGGEATAPAGAPKRVKEVIAAANKIEDKPYRYGGGHGSFRDTAYDCSGAVSFALHGGDLLASPLDSVGLGHFGERGKGHWITIYANRDHAYMVVAGLRFDTAMTPGDGPGWSKSLRSINGRFRVRHPAGL